MSQFITTLQRFSKTVGRFMVFAFFVAAPLLTTAGPVVSTASAAPNCNPTFLGIPAWYRGLAVANGDSCDIQVPSGSNGLSTFIWTIVLNVLDMLMVATAYIAAGFIIYGGFIWLTGGAQPAQVAKGRKTILNAVIGLVIAIMAIALNNLIFTNLVK